MMSNTGKYLRLFVVAAAFVTFGATTANASTFTFTFNGLAGSSATAVQTNMNGILGAGKTVDITVVGGSDSTVIGNQNYTGEGYVVGPGGIKTSDTGCGHEDRHPCYSPVTSLTLGNTEGATNASSVAGAADSFLYTYSATGIKMDFTGLIIDSVSFDYEIFPDYLTAAPDFTFKAGSSTLVYALGVTPSTSVSPWFTHSPNSGGSTEGEQQLGPMHFVSASGLGVTHLEFLDWPVTIGIDNLVINTPTPPQVPEPATLSLLGLGLIGTAAAARRRSLKRQQ